MRSPWLVMFRTWHRLNGSLRARLFIPVAVLSTLTFAGMILASVQAYSLDLQRALHDRAILFSNLAAQGVVGHFVDQGPKDVETLLQTLKSHRSDVTSVSIVRFNGSVAHSSDPALIGYQWRPHQLDREGPLIVSQGSWFAVLKPIDGGWLDVRFSNDSLADAESKLFSTLVAAATPLWLFMLAVAFWLLGREAVNPIQRLVRAMQRARAGEQDVRADEGRPDEIGKAARKFDRTLEALLRSQQELQRAYEARMVKADRFAAIGQMATGLAHEIKNPLAGLSGALELLAEDMQKSTHAEVIGEMQNQVTRLSEIMEGLLSYARPPRANLTSTQVNDVLEKVLFLLAHQKHRTARIVREFDPSLPAAHADPSQLQQVFLNVILNAYEAVNGSGGMITVRTSGDAEGVLVEIADTGPGIPEAIRPDIFTPFFTTRTTGTGLGLAISARLISEHGGRISFRCPPEGGTVFSIRLLKDQPVELAKTA